MGMNFGYKASAEQFGPGDLLRFSVHAEEAGLDTIAVSDHFQPWRHTTGHAPNALVWLGAAGQATKQATLATSVLTPTLRYEPAIIAQAFATLGDLYPGRVILGVGTGEAMNETPVTGGEFPGAKERRMRMAEAITMIRRLWTEDRVTFEGEYYRTENATIYDKPEHLVPIHVAASGPLAAKLAGRVGDGFICTSGKDPELYEKLLTNVREGAEAAGRDYESIERMIEIKVSYDEDIERARTACGWWAALGLSGEEKAGVEDPLEMERLADAAIDRAHKRFICSDAPGEIVDQIKPYVELGFTRLIFHMPGHDQIRYIDEFCADVLPLMRERFAAVAA